MAAFSRDDDDLQMKYVVYQFGGAAQFRAVMGRSDWD
jgi:hypothetical protein